MTADPPTNRRNLVWPVLKWGLCLAVLVFVAVHASRLWQDDQLQYVEVNFGWLFAAMVVYLIGWIPSAWYWRRLMRAMNQPVGMLDSVSAYYCGHLGKYIPGKAFVLVIRAGMLKSRGHSAAISAVTATFETLLLMGAGIAVGLALFPVTNWPPRISEWIDEPWLMPVIVTVAVFAALPVISILLTRIATKMTPKEMRADGPKIQIPVKLIATGLAVFMISWGLLGLSLGLTLQAVSDDPLDLTNWPMWTGAAALATSVGFIAVFAPGGFGPRELLLFEIVRIQPGVGAKQAAIAAILLRLTWLAAELIAALVLFYCFRGRAGSGNTST